MLVLLLFIFRRRSNCIKKKPHNLFYSLLIITAICSILGAFIDSIFLSNLHSQYLYVNAINLLSGAFLVALSFFIPLYYYSRRCILSFSVSGIIGILNLKLWTIQLIAKYAIDMTETYYEVWCWLIFSLYIVSTLLLAFYSKTNERYYRENSYSNTKTEDRRSEKEDKEVKGNSRENDFGRDAL